MIGVELPRNKSTDQASFSYSDISDHDILDGVVVPILLHFQYVQKYVLIPYLSIINSSRQTKTELQLLNQTMQPEELSPNGIDRLLKGEAVVLQIFNTKMKPVAGKMANVDMITACVSDGFSYVQDIYLFPTNFPHTNREFNVIKIKLADGSVRKIQKGLFNMNIITDSNQVFVITNRLNKKIGNPILHSEFVKNGRKNPKGSRKINDIPAPKIYQRIEDEEDTEDDLFIQAQKIQKKLQQQQKAGSKQKSNAMNTNSNSNAYNINKNKTVNQNSNKNSSMQRDAEESSRAASNNNSRQNNSTSKPIQQPKQKNNPPNKPIIKIEQPKKQQKRNSIKPQVKHHQQDHEKIKQLFLGIQNFRLVARLLFIWPIKMITNKKGNQSQLLNLQFGDESGTIMCTVFGDNATRYSNLQADAIYDISGATVSETTYKGITELKLNVNDGTKIGILNHQVGNVPPINKFCLSLKQLNQTQVGRVVSVICLIKETQLVQFVSKNGNNVKKKVLKMFDLDNQIQSELTLFNQKAQIDYPNGMYALKGVQIDQFQNNKNFKGSLMFMARYLKDHPLNKRVNQIDQLTFTCVGSNQKTSKRQSIQSFSVLNEKSQQLQVKQSLWSQVVCYLKTVRIGGNSKNVYLSCPHCKKKVEQGSNECDKCKKDFDQAKYKYLLSINVMDDHDNIWVSCYDEGEKILNLPNQEIFTADSFAQTTQDNLRKRIGEIRYKRLKLKIVTNKQQYNNQVRIKHKVIRVMPIDYHQQNVNLLKKIKSITESL